MRKHETVNSSKVHEINLQHNNLSSSNSLASCENTTEAQYLLGFLNNYELALGGWKIDGDAEDGKQANALALNPAIKSQYHRKW